MALRLSQLPAFACRLRSCEAAEAAAAAGWRAAVGQLEEQAALHQQRAQLQDARAAALEDALSNERAHASQVRVADKGMWHLEGTTTAAGCLCRLGKSGEVVRYRTCLGIRCFYRYWAAGDTAVR